MIVLQNTVVRGTVKGKSGETTSLTPRLTVIDFFGSWMLLSFSLFKYAAFC